MAIADSKMRELLSDLNDQIVRLVHQRMQDGSLGVRTETYVLRPNFGLHYSVDPTALNFGVEEVSEKTCENDLLEKFVLTPAKALREFQVIATKFSPESREVDVLEGFVSAVALDVIAEAITLDRTTRHIDTVMADFEDKELEYRVKVWLVGIKLTAECVPVNDFLCFRSPKRSDLQERISAKTTHYAHAVQMRTDFSCIADMVIQSQFPIGVQRAVEKLVITLRLFRLGAVAASRYDLDAKSFSPFARCSFGGLSSSGVLKYTLSPADGPILAGFLHQITKHIPNSYGLSEDKPDFLTTALHWYETALLGRFRPEAAVASCVASLEALFLENVQAEITYRLAQRVAGLLRWIGYSPLEIKHVLIKQAYEVRSRYVHGEMQNKKWNQERLYALARTVSNYVRVSLLIFCQLRKSLSRSVLLQLVDESLLDDSSREKLQVWCRRVEGARAPAVEVDKRPEN